MSEHKTPISPKEKALWKKILEACPYGIMHIVSPRTGDKKAVLVEIEIADNTSLSCTIEHSTDNNNIDISDNSISLKLCNRDENLYAVADVKLHPSNISSTGSKAKLRLLVQKLSCFRKNKAQQLISYFTA